MSKTDMQEQWREEFEAWCPFSTEREHFSIKGRDYAYVDTESCWIGYLKAKQSSQIEIEKLQKENQELVGLLREVYAEVLLLRYDTYSLQLKRRIDKAIGEANE